MASIGSGGFSPLNLYSSSPLNSLAGPAASSFAFAPTGPTGMGYGRQAMGDIDLILALLELLQQGATAPNAANPNANTGPSAIAAAGGKGGQALARAGGKAAPALRQAGGKGNTLKKAAGK